MDELPIILVSNDLKYAMTPLKIKTFERARQYYYTQREAVESGQLQIEQLVGVSDKLQKIKKYMQKYNTVREDVLRKVRCCHIDDENQQLNHNAQSLNNHPSTQILPFNQIREVYVPSYEESDDEQGLLDIPNIIPQTLHKQQGKLQPNLNSIKPNTTPLNFDFDLHNKAPTFKEQWDKTQLKIPKRQSSLQQLSPTSEQKLQKLNLFQKSMVDSSIVQLYGDKSTGKTALLMYFCQKYAETSPKKVYFINCGGGVTYKRFERLQRNCPNLEYRDSYILDHVLAVCKSAAQDEDTGCIAVDSLTNLLMEEEKTLIFLIKLFKIFSYLQNKDCKVILTNYLQQSFDHHEDDPLTNHYSYYCAVTSEFVTYKYFLAEVEGKDRVQVKMCRGGFIEAEFTVGEDGIEEIQANIQGQRLV